MGMAAVLPFPGTASASVVAAHEVSTAEAMQGLHMVELEFIAVLPLDE